MAEKNKESKKEKRPTAKKRDMQSEKRRVRNKTFRSQVSTAVKSFSKSLEAEMATKNLSAIYSLVDKGVKKGILKANKAARIKSKLTKSRAAAK